MHHPLEPTDAQVIVAANALKMLADATRLKLLWQLAENGETDVTTLSEVISVPRPVVSQHLAKLRLAGLVNTRREGRRIYYRITGGHVRVLITEVLNAADHHITGAPEHD